jgi:hypothetical protein
MQNARRGNMGRWDVFLRTEAELREKIRLEHDCETPVDGSIQHKWTCKKCGKRWEIVGFDDRANPEWEMTEGV